MKAFSLVLIVTSFMSQAAIAGLVPVVSLTQNGSEAALAVPQEDFTRVMEASVGSVHETVLPELACSSRRPGWELDSVIVGVEITGKVGLGPIISVSATKAMHLVYSRSSKPVIIPVP